MPGKIPLSLACGDYEITRPLQEGSVAPDGLALTILTAMDSSTRHWRFLRAQAFDIAELSSSSSMCRRAESAGVQDLTRPCRRS
jgi:4,5-dihydroxyphthalate decarboxylase